MLSLSNTLSLLRAPLAFGLLIPSAPVRFIVIFIAMCTDCLDGYLARKQKTASRFGAILDPAMDKFFVYFALIIFLSEGNLKAWEACSMLSRDFFLCLFGLYLGFSHRWKTFKFQSIRWGKISTSMQFLSLMTLSLHIQIPSLIFFLFIVTGCLAFIELLKLRTSFLK